MSVAFAACLCLFRYHYWFLQKRQIGLGFCFLTLLFYIAMAVIPYMGFAPFFEGDRSILQWASCAGGLAFLIIGFPRLPKVRDSSDSAVVAETAENRPSTKGVLIAAIACGLVAVASPAITVCILKNKPPVKNVQQPPPSDFTGLTNPPSIVFSTALPPSWSITEQSAVTNQGYFVGNRVVLRSADQKRTIIVSVVGKKTEGEAEQAFFDTWKATVIDGLKSGYGNAVQEDGFSINHPNGRNVAHLESHALTTNGILNFLTEGWVEKGFPVTCQSIGNGVAITNDEEIGAIFGNIKLRN